MNLKDVSDIQKATKRGQNEFFRFGIGLLFVASIMIYSSLGLGLTGTNGILLVVASMIGGYMAMNIGANDVANNVGPAVGSRSISMAGAIVIAAVFEVAGALIAGGDVVSTIRGDIIDVSMVPDSRHFIALMTAALLAGALWLNFATAVGAPVSTTHSIVGAVLGAGIAAGGFAAADWGVMAKIAASWVISPVLGGLVAAGFLIWIKRAITYKADMVAAARGTVPVLIGVMAFSFATYLILKGISKLWKVDFLTASAVGMVIGLLVWFFMKGVVARRSLTLQNTKKDINSLFTIPLIFAAALLSFAHGANDVANAIGPLAAIADTVMRGGVSGQAGIPLWVMLIGAMGIAIGLALYGPKLIRTVGGEITDLDQMRAFSIAIGGIFGVGFLREHLKSSYSQKLEEIKLRHSGSDKEQVEAFLNRFAGADVKAKKEMLNQLKAHTADVLLTKKEYKKMRKVYKGELVKRTAVTKIVAAWLITVPASALMAAGIYLLIVSLL